MKKIELKTRQFLRKVFKGVSLTSLAFVFQACYGPLPDDRQCDVNFSGRVVSASTNWPVEGIKIIVDEGLVYGFTDINGRYDLYATIPGLSNDGVKVHFQDIDGTANRHFADTTISVQCGCYGKTTINVELMELQNE